MQINRRDFNHGLALSLGFLSFRRFATQKQVPSSTTPPASSVSRQS